MWKKISSMLSFGAIIILLSLMITSAFWPFESSSNSPITARVTQSPNSPTGWLDGIGSDGVAGGWAIDEDYSGSINIHFYVDGPAGSGTFAGALTANKPSSDVIAAGFGQGDNRYNFDIPNDFRDGQMHTLYAHAIGLRSDGVPDGDNPLLLGVPKDFILNSRVVELKLGETCYPGDSQSYCSTGLVCYDSNRDGIGACRQVNLTAGSSCDNNRMCAPSLTCISGACSQILQNEAPKVYISSSPRSSFSVNSVINFTASATDDKALARWRIYLSNNPDPQWTELSNSGNVSNLYFSHRFTQTGDFSWIVEAQDTDGAISRTTLNITISPTNVNIPSNVQPAILPSVIFKYPVGGEVYGVDGIFNYLLDARAGDFMELSVYISATDEINPNSYLLERYSANVSLSANNTLRFPGYSNLSKLNLASGNYYIIGKVSSSNNEATSIIPIQITSDNSLGLKERKILSIDKVQIYPHDENSRYSKGSYFSLSFTMQWKGIDPIANATYSLYSNGMQVFSKTTDCKDLSGCGIEWYVGENVPAGRNMYNLSLTVTDTAGYVLTSSRELYFTFQDVDRSLCKEAISNHNNLNANRANVVFVGFSDRKENEFGNFRCSDAVAKKCNEEGYTKYTIQSYQSNSVSFTCEYKVAGVLPSKNFNLTYSELNKYGSCSPSETIVSALSEYLVDEEGDNRGLLSVEPFKSNRDKFNFWYVDKISNLSSCISYSGNFAYCQDDENLASSCVLPNKYVTHLVDLNFRSNTGFGSISKTQLSTPELSINEWVTRTFVHEFGHQFGELYDEYVETAGSVQDGEHVSSNSNCYAGPVKNNDECLANAPWKSLIGDGCGKPGIIDCDQDDENYAIEIKCVEGCYHNEFKIFRNSFNTIMRNQGGSPYSFGSWNERLIKNRLNKFTGI